MEFTNMLFTILLFLPLQNIQPSFASTTPQPYKDFVKTYCSTTTYPSLCYKTLSPYAASIRKSPLKLCNAALNVSLQSAKNASATVSKVAKQKGISSKDARAIKDCIENIGDSIDELKQSVKAMGRIGSSDNKRFQMDTIKTYVSAAITDEDTCTDGLVDSKVSTSVKNKIKSVIKNFEKITSNALSLINHLKY